MTIAWRRARLVSSGGIPGKAIGLGVVAGLFVAIGYLCSGASPASRPTTMPASPDATTTADGVPIVRVRIAKQQTSIEIDAADGRGAVTYAAADLKAPINLAQPADGSSLIAVAGKRYRGNVRLVPSLAPGTTTAEAPTMDVVNIIAVEEYLRGVVPSEMPASWPAPALQAQAVAARTYALYIIKSREAAATARARMDEDDDSDVPTPTRSFDLNADQSSQAYKGIERESAVSDAVVAATRGMVLADGPAGSEKIFCALFSACCGGATLGGRDYANGDATPALAEHLGDGCTDSPRFRWSDLAIRKDELTRRVRAWGARVQSPVANVGPIRSVEIDARNTLGRPIRFAIVDDAGGRFVLRSEQFRNAFNNDRPEKQTQLLSAFITPVDAGDSIRITDGRGWGHGVGLCQWCARGWAMRGQDFKQILAASYPGATLVRAY